MRCMVAVAVLFLLGACTNKNAARERQLEGAIEDVARAERGDVDPLVMVDCTLAADKAAKWRSSGLSEEKVRRYEEGCSHGAPLAVIRSRLERDGATGCGEALIASGWLAPSVRAAETPLLAKLRARCCDPAVTGCDSLPK